MGTRALTVIKEEDGKDICVIYRQFDGYPSGLGLDLKTILTKGPLVNGISGSGHCYNGMGCLAAQVIGALKEGRPGNVYVHPANTRNCGEEYTYIVYPKDRQIHLTVKSGVVTFFGMPGTPEDQMDVLFDGLISEFNPETCGKEGAE